MKDPADTVQGAADVTSYKLDPFDILVEDYEVIECECGSGEPITKVLSIDVRALGERLIVGAFCEECTAHKLARIRESLK